MMENGAESESATGPLSSVSPVDQELFSNGLNTGLTDHTYLMNAKVIAPNQRATDRNEPLEVGTSLCIDHEIVTPDTGKQSYAAKTQNVYGQRYREKGKEVDTRPNNVGDSGHANRLLNPVCHDEVHTLPVSCVVNAQGRYNTDQTGVVQHRHNKDSIPKDEIKSNSSEHWSKPLQATSQFGNGYQDTRSWPMCDESGKQATSTITQISLSDATESQLNDVVGEYNKGDLCKNKEGAVNGLFEKQSMFKSSKLKHDNSEQSSDDVKQVCNAGDVKNNKVNIAGAEKRAGVPAQKKKRLLTDYSKSNSVSDTHSDADKCIQPVTSLDKNQERGVENNLGLVNNHSSLDSDYLLQVQADEQSCDTLNRNTEIPHQVISSLNSDSIQPSSRCDSIQDFSNGDQKQKSTTNVSNTATNNCAVSNPHSSLSLEHWLSPSELSTGVRTDKARINALSPALVAHPAAVSTALNSSLRQDISSEESFPVSSESLSGERSIDGGGKQIEGTDLIAKQDLGQCRAQPTQLSAPSTPHPKVCGEVAYDTIDIAESTNQIRPFASGSRSTTLDIHQRDCYKNNSKNRELRGAGTDTNESTCNCKSSDQFVGRHDVTNGEKREGFFSPPHMLHYEEDGRINNTTKGASIHNIPNLKHTSDGGVLTTKFEGGPPREVDNDTPNKFNNHGENKDSETGVDAADLQLNSEGTVNSLSNKQRPSACSQFTELPIQNLGTSSSNTTSSVSALNPGSQSEFNTVSDRVLESSQQFKNGRLSFNPDLPYSERSVPDQEQIGEISNNVRGVNPNGTGDNIYVEEPSERISFTYSSNPSGEFDENSEKLDRSLYPDLDAKYNSGNNVFFKLSQSAGDLRENIKANNDNDFKRKSFELHLLAAVQRFSRPYSVETEEDKKPLLQSDHSPDKGHNSRNHSSPKMGEPVALKKYSRREQEPITFQNKGENANSSSVYPVLNPKDLDLGDGSRVSDSEFQVRGFTSQEKKISGSHSNGDHFRSNNAKVGPSASLEDGEQRRDREKELETDDEDVGGPCGWGRCQLSFCQRFRDPRWFLVVIVLCGACQGMAINGFVNTVISTIETRFEISSTESGLIASCYDIMFVLLVIPVSYFGGSGHKPRYLGIGIFILGIGSFVFSLPHFITGNYDPGNSKETLCQINGTVADPCETEVSGLSDFKYMFFLGQMLHGAGATALYTLGVTYIDENVPQRLSSFYCGIFYTGSIIGPAVGYMLGSELLKIYTDTGVDPVSLGLDTSNPRWVGAWWIGFLISGIMGVLLSLPLLAFPASLPGSQKYAQERGKEAQAQKNVDKTGQSRGIRDVLLSIKLLLTNIPFMCINLAAAADGIIVGGFSTFMPKFIEYQFGTTAAKAALYVGLAIVPAGGGATFLGGWMVKFFNLRMRGILRLCIIASALLLVAVLSLLMECDSVAFAGVTLEYGKANTGSTKFLGEKRLISQCNANCGCVEEDYYPMCGKDNVMYFSPCYAGCQNIYQDGDTKLYSNCSCVVYNATDSSPYVGEFGKCERTCDWINFFLVIFSIQIVFVFITSMPSLTATLRCVPDHQRSFGLGIQWIVARCLGSIPGPILFGKMFDLACLVWQKRCDGSGSCFFYDNHTMSINLLILALVFSFLTFLFFSLAAFFYKAAPVLDDITLEVNGVSETTVATDVIETAVK